MLTLFLVLENDLVCFPFAQALQTLSLVNFILGGTRTRPLQQVSIAKKDLHDPDVGVTDHHHRFELFDKKYQLLQWNQGLQHTCF